LDSRICCNTLELHTHQVAESDPHDVKNKSKNKSKNTSDDSKYNISNTPHGCSVTIMPRPRGARESAHARESARGTFTCVAVWCNVMQCDAVCCSVLQCVAVCCSVLQCVAVRCSVMQCVAVCCSVLQCVAVCCSALQCVAVCCSVLYCLAVCSVFRGASCAPHDSHTRVVCVHLRCDRLCAVCVCVQICGVVWPVSDGEFDCVCYCVWESRSVCIGVCVGWSGGGVWSSGV